MNQNLAQPPEPAGDDAATGICPFVVGAWARLLQVAPTLIGAVDDELKEAGLPPRQWYDALAALDRAPGNALAPGDIETGLLLTQCTTSRLIDRLEAEGLVVREVNPGDRRRQVIRLAAPGQNLLGRMWPVLARAIGRHLGNKLGDGDARALIGILEKLT